jgi:hypothetical protein
MRQNRTKYQTNPEYALSVDRATAYADQLCQVALVNLRARPNRRWECEAWELAHTLAMHTAERMGLR